MPSTGRAVLASLFAVLSLCVHAGEHVSGAASVERPCVLTLQGCVATTLPAIADRPGAAAAHGRNAPKSLTATALTPLHRPEDSDRSDFEPTYYAESGADGVWAVGHANYATLAVKFDALGQPIAHAHVPISKLNNFFAVRYSDGGLLLAGTSSSTADYSSCTVHRIAADGRLLWSEPVSAFITEECGALGVDADGAIWIYLRHAFPSRVVRLSADGNAVMSVDLTPHFAREVREMIVDTASPGAWIGGSTAADGQSIRARILRIDARGQVTWTWDSQRNGTESEVVAMGVSAPYGVQAVLGVPPTEPDGYARTWRTLRLNAAGVQIYDRDISFDRAVQVQAISAADASGNWVALRSSDGPQPVSMVRFDLAGSTGELHGINDAERCGDELNRYLRCRIHLRQDGGAWLQVHYFRSSSQIPRHPQLIGIDGDGVERFRQPVFFGNRPTLRADDSILASAIVMYPPYVQEVPVPYTARFGDSLQPWTDARDLYPSYLKQPTAAFTRHGDPIVLGEYGNQGHSEYSRNFSSLEYFPSVDSGESPWRSTYAGTWNVDDLRVGTQSVCFRGGHYPQPYAFTMGLRCHRRADGLALWQWDSESGPARRFVQPLDDGRSISILDVAGTAEHSVVDINGLPLSAARVYPLQGYALDVSFNDSGDALLRYRSSDYTNSLMSLRADGTQRYKISPPGTLLYDGAHLLADGSALIWHSNGLELYSPVGTFVWSQSFEEVSVSSEVLISGASVVMRRRPASPFVEQQWNHFDAFDLHSGNVLWSRRFPARTRFIPPVIAMIDDEHIGVAEANDTRLTWRVLDAASGNLLREQSDACGASDCGAPQLHLRADGRARMVMSTWSPQQGHGTQILGLEHAVDALPAVRADQPGVSGAWYAPTSTGQGLMMQWLPSARTLFAPWFTYTKQGGNAHSELRWYALQGSVAPEALIAEVGIYRNTGGDFATGTTSAQRVGSATLRFESCERAHLHYRFDPGFNDDLEGVVTLTRLTPGQPCIGAANTTAAAKAGSLDAEFDGAWFDPAASGQGLMFSRYPSASGDSGTLFAPWFTFDPATAPDDATEQHWFTLQGIYDGSGQSVLTIFRTTGGSFDAGATRNTNPVGSATLQRTGCDSAALTYRFHDTEIAGRFRGLTGSVALRKAGGCN